MAILEHSYILSSFNCLIDIIKSFS